MKRHVLTEREVRELRSEINKYVTKAESILENMPSPNREAFQRLFKSEMDLFACNKTDASYHFEEYIANLEKEERFKQLLIAVRRIGR